MIFRFNKIYIVESLPEHDEKTGSELYNDVVRWKSFNNPNLKSELISPNNKIEWKSFIDKVLSECAQDGILPLVHFEIHGSTNKNGLILASKELITWEEIYDSLVKINIECRMNLFVSLAVCHGAYLLTQYRISKRAFCIGLLGSFKTLPVSDLKIRFNEFYEELLTSFNIDKAYKNLLNSNPDSNIEYVCISAIEIFYHVYRHYINNEVNNKRQLKKRSIKAINERGVISLRRQRRIYQKRFRQMITKTKDEFYKEHSSIFFMFDLFPEKRDDYNIPDSLNEFMRQKIVP